MKRFFYLEKGNRGEAWYYLGRDAQTGAVYVECKWAARGILGSKRIAITDFLRARGHWVPASSLAFGGTLPFVLTCIERTTDRREWLSIAARLVDYFQKGELKPIT
jgi:hypothetical protein